MSRTHVLAQLGQYCTNRLCKTCPISEIAKAHHHGCPECLRVPEIADEVSKLIQKEKPRKDL